MSERAQAAVLFQWERAADTIMARFRNTPDGLDRLAKAEADYTRELEIKGLSVAKTAQEISNLIAQGERAVHSLSKKSDDQR